MTADEPTQRTRLFRGRQCPIVKTVRNTTTGVIYDMVSYKRQVTNRRDNSSQEVTLTRRLRRAGTGAAFADKEVEIEPEIEAATAT